MGSCFTSLYFTFSHWDVKEMEPAEMMHLLRPTALLVLFKKRKALLTKGTVMQMLQINTLLLVLSAKLKLRVFVIH